MSSFQFKQFSVFQEHSAMKVGTDGVLLGAWANCDNAQTILDIGSGTGLVSLMLAQRNMHSQITAVEIDKNAADECRLNFKNSPWSHRLNILFLDIKSFKNEVLFDSIISNPPFFNNSFKSNTKSRNQARQTETLSFEDLLSSTSSLLSPNGKASFVIPFQEENKFVKIAKEFNLFLNRVTHVKGNIHTEVIRSILEFSFKEKQLIQTELAIEISRHVYTEEYIALTKDFYLKM